MGNPSLGFDPATNGLGKPAKGSFRQARMDKRADTHQHEQAELQAALKRDERKCRYPGCKGSYRGIKQPIDPAHVKQPDGTWHRGNGGDRTGGTRTSRAWAIALCRFHHQEYDGGAIDIEALTPAAMNGPVAFYRKDEAGKWQNVANETARGVSVAVGA